MSVLEAASLLTLLLSPITSVGASLCGWIAHLAAEGILGSARFTELVPVLARDVVPPSLAIVAAYYAAAAVAVFGGRQRIRSVSAMCAAAIVIDIAAGPWAITAWAAREPPLRIVFLDVGQGDATVVLLPGGHAMLVDAGGIAGAAAPVTPGTGEAADAADVPDREASGFDVGRRVVVPALRALGVRQLDVLSISHGDPDHVGGASAVLQSFRPAVVWEGVPVPPHPWLRQLIATADDLGVRWRTVQPGDVERLGPVRMGVLHPPPPEWERQRVRNDDSIVLDVRIGAYRSSCLATSVQKGSRRSCRAFSRRESSS